MSISKRAKNTAPSPTLGITAKVKALKAQGKDVIGFGAGEPDFDTPEYIKQAAIDGLKAGYTKYTPSSGDVDLKDAIVAKLARDNGLKYGREHVIVSCGAKHSLYNVFQALLDTGDEVIIPSPYWVSYPEQVKLADGVPVALETSPDENFMPSADAIRKCITPKTKAIILNSPSNPTGGVASKAQVQDLMSIATEHNLYVVSDEIYEKLLYDGRQHLSPASLGPEAFARTVTVNGCSKAYSMTGWRIGYIACADTELVSAMGRIQDQSTSNPTSFAQKGAVAALKGSDDSVNEMRAAFEQRRERIVALLNAIPGVTCRTPGGAFYAFPDVSALYGRHAGEKTIDSSDALAEYLLEAVGVAVVPGSGFGADAYVRLSYATSMENIERGLQRMEAAIRKLE
jgi:aspartate aminotransferase